MHRFLTARLGRAALLLPVLLTGACASIPNLGPKPEMRAASAYASAASFAAARSDWPADGWWKRYRDSQLDGLMAEALAGSPDLRAAAARMRTAEGFAQRAGSALKPSLDAFSQPELAKQSQNQAMPAAAIPNGWNDSGSIGLSFSLDLDLWGKNRAAARAANSDADAAQFELQEAELALTASIASTYAELGSLYAQRDSLESALDIRTQTAKLVIQRVDAGLGTEADSKQATARIAQARGDIEATEEATNLTKTTLYRSYKRHGRSYRADQECARRPRRRGPGSRLGNPAAAGRLPPGAGYSRRRVDRPDRPSSRHCRLAGACRSGSSAHQGGASRFLSEHQSLCPDWAVVLRARQPVLRRIDLWKR
jgi:hypothetical protein